MSKVLFLDIDGPLIPGRAYPRGYRPDMELFLAGVYNKFDQVAIDNLNHICEEFGWKLVIHSSWIRYAGPVETFEHCVKEGLKETNFHNHFSCDREEHFRYTRIAKWLAKHPEVTEYLILDDQPYHEDFSGYPHPEDMAEHVLLVDFEDGLLSKHYERLRGKM